MLGAQSPPFLESVTGDLTFRDFTAGDEGRLVVRTVERSAEEARQPKIHSDLPFLEFRRNESRAEPVGESSDTILRTSTYRVILAAAPVDDSFFGEVRVVDPWDPEHIETLPIRGESSPPIRIVPARLVIRSEKDLPQSFLVYLKVPVATETLRLKPVGQENPFVVEPKGGSTKGQGQRFTLRWKPEGEPRPGVYDIVIESPADGVRTTLHILIPEGEP